MKSTNNLLSRIQFQKHTHFPCNFQEELTIDYTLRLLTYSCVDNISHTAKTKCASFGNSVSELLALSSCDVLLDWLDTKEKHESYGYRDGWKIVCYLTLYGNDKSLVCSMQEIYMDSPFEKLLSWLKAFAPEVVPDW